MNLLRKFRFYSYLISLSKELLAWFYRLPNVITNGINKAANQYNLYGNSKQEIEGFDYTNYTPVEYCRNASNTKVQTGIIPSVEECEYYCRFYAAGVDSLYLFTSRGGATQGSTQYGISGSSTGGTITFILSGTTITSAIARTAGHIYTVKATCTSAGAMTLYVKDETDGTEDTVTGTVSSWTVAESQIDLFGNEFQNYLQSGYRIYEAYYKEAGVEKLHYYPATDSNSNVGFFDTVSQTFKTATSGSLTAGSVLPTPTTPVDIESCGDYVGQKNQLINYTTVSTQTVNGITFTNNNDGSWTVNGTATADARISLLVRTDIPSHVCFLSGCPSGGSTGTYRLYDAWMGTADYGDGNIYTSYELGNTAIRLQVKNGVTVNNLVFKPQLIDLTQMFGAGNEPSTVAGAKAKIAEVMGGEQDYYPYNAGSDYYKIPVIAGSNCGCVDLGSLTWNYNTSKQRFNSGVIDFMYAVAGSNLNMCCNLYTTSIKATSDSDRTDLQIASYYNNGINRLYLRNFAYTNATAFKQAMSGVYLYYQRTTDTSWTTPTTTNIYLDEPLRKVGNYIDKIHFGQGKNLLNLNATNTSNGYKAGYYQDSTGTEVANSSYNISEYIPVLPETTYYYAIDGVDTTGKSGHNAPRPAFYSSSKTYLSSLSTILNVGASFTTPANCYYVKLPLYTQCLSEEMFIEGSTAPTEYHPYSDTPQLNQYIGVKVLDGTENWAAWTGSGAGLRYHVQDLLPTIYAYNVTISSTHFAGQVSGGGSESYDNNSIWLQSTSSYPRMYIRLDDITTVADLKTWLSSQYSAGTPVNIIYPLATSTSEVISLPTLTPASGTTIYTVPTKVQPFVSVNLFDKDNVNWIYGDTEKTYWTYLRDDSGYQLTKGNQGYEPSRTFYIDAEPSTTYTITFGNTTCTKRVGSFTSIAINTYPTSYVANTTANTATITTGANDKYLIIQLYINDDYSSTTIAARSADLIPSVQIQEGSSATTYEPYCNGMEVQAYVTEETSTPASIDSNGVVTATGSIDSNGVTTLNGTIDSNGVVTL